jgi:hypothetical protein
VSELGDLPVREESLLGLIRARQLDASGGVASQAPVTDGEVDDQCEHAVDLPDGGRGDAVASEPRERPVAPPGLAGGHAARLAEVDGVVAGIVGFGACGIMMILGRRNRSNMAVGGATGIPWVLGGLSLMSLASGLVGAVLS